MPEADNREVIAMLAKKLAAGEITPEQYEEMKEALEEAAQKGAALPSAIETAPVVAGSPPPSSIPKRSFKTPGIIAASVMGVALIVVGVFWFTRLVAIDDQAETMGDQEIAIAVLDNDKNANPNASLEIIQEPVNGNVRVHPEGTIIYQPERRFSGEDQFRYRVGGTMLDETDATVTITVSPRPNTPPQAVDDTLTIPSYVMSYLEVLKNDQDEYTDELTLEIIDYPKEGPRPIVNNYLLEYKARDWRAYRNRTQRFTYRITDREGQSDSATVFLTIRKGETLIDEQRAGGEFTSFRLELPEPTYLLRKWQSLGGGRYSICNANSLRGFAFIGAEEIPAYTVNRGIGYMDIGQWTSVDSHTFVSIQPLPAGNYGMMVKMRSVGSVCRWRVIVEKL